MLDGYEISDTNKLMPKEGQLRISSSNEVSDSCPPFDIEKRKQLKLLLKDIAKKIIKETYYEHRQNSSDLHQSVFPATTN
jgi:hypothetical protein